MNEADRSILLTFAGLTTQVVAGATAATAWAGTLPDAESVALAALAHAGPGLCGVLATLTGTLLLLRAEDRVRFRLWAVMSLALATWQLLWFAEQMLGPGNAADGALATIAAYSANTGVFGGLAFYVAWRLAGGGTSTRQLRRDQVRRALEAARSVARR